MANYQIHVDAHITSGNSLKFTGNDTSNFVGLSVPALTGTANFKLPIADGTTGQALVTDGSHGLYFTTIVTSDISSFSTMNSKGFVIDAPSSDADYMIWKAPEAITIQSVAVICTGAAGANVVGFLDEADANGLNASAVSGDVTAVSGTNFTTSTFDNAGIDANDWIRWHTTSTSGVVDSVSITFNYTIG